MFPLCQACNRILKEWPIIGMNNALDRINFRTVQKCTQTMRQHRERAQFAILFRHAATGPRPNGRVHLFCDEFTNYNDSAAGIKAD